MEEEGFKVLGDGWLGFEEMDLGFIWGEEGKESIAASVAATALRKTKVTFAKSCREEEDELAEVEAKLDADLKANSGASKSSNKADDDESKKHKRPFLSQFFSPIFLKAFSITFFGEWGDRSQLATIGLAADENAIGVVLGGILRLLQLFIVLLTEVKHCALLLLLLEERVWHPGYLKE
ncbi:hypothetical protein RIF29_16333 [Crotalaria pallida]|uniref:GDT1 family protein n=1 Tax=Crotalaria pallida TaxID=3830 RepID=A0AAN9FGF1_CROPI